MKRITHKEIEEQNLITNPVQLRVYEWLKQFKNVWFCDGPIYVQTVHTEVPYLDGVKIVPDCRTYEMHTERLCSLKVGENGWTDQKCVSEVKYHIEKKLRQCHATNNILMIYVSPNGLWGEGNTIYDPKDFEPRISILPRWRMIPRDNGGILVPVGEATMGVEPIPEKNYYYLLRRR